MSSNEQQAFVHIEDSMGGDKAIVNAARISYGKSINEMTDRDVGLLRRLMRDKHGTPFEMAILKFYIRCPIFVAREWMRHRIGCLAGDTEITLVAPNGVAKKRTIKEIYDLKYGGVVDQMPVLVKNGVSKNGTPVFRDARRRYKNPERVRVLPNCQERVMRVLDEETGMFTTGTMKEVWESGVKSVYLVETVKGKKVRASAEHPFLTQRGWVNTSDLTAEDSIATQSNIAAQDLPYPPSLRQGIGVWTTMMRNRLIPEQGAFCYKCLAYCERDELALDHVVPVIEDLTMALDESNLKPMCHTCHRIKTNSEQSLAQRKLVMGVRMVALKQAPVYVGEEMTYDIEMDGPHHNYLADSLVVHNSYNEVSSRYKELPMDYFIPIHFREPAPEGVQMDYKYIPMSDEMNAKAKVVAKKAHDAASHAYQELLGLGVAKEHARIVLPVATYTEFIWTVNARSLMNFLSLRMAPTAQQEIRDFAKIVDHFWGEDMPHTHAAFHEFGRIAP